MLRVKGWRCCWFKTYMLLGLLCLSSSAMSSLTSEQLASYDIDIFQAPETAYQTLLTQSQLPSVDRQNHIWLMLRKAQAEDILTLYQDMSKTLTAVQSDLPQMTNTQKATYHYLNGINAHKNGKFTTAVNELQTAINSTLMRPNQRLYVLAIRELGYVHALAGEYYQANLVLHQAYEKLVSYDNIFFNALIEESLGDTYNYSGNYRAALSYYQSALVYFQQLNYQPFIASTLLGLATVHRKLEQWDGAIATFDLYETAFAFANSYSEKYYLYYGRAMTLAEKGDCNSAISAIDKALSLTGIVDYDAELYKQRAFCDISLGDITTAKTDLANAQGLFDSLPELHGTQWHLELDYIKGVIAAQEGNYRQAYQYIDAYYKAFIALQDQINSERIAQLQTTLEAQRKDKEIELLRKNKQIQKNEATEQALKVQQQRIVIFSVAIVSLLLLAFGIFQYRNSQRLLALSIRDDLTGLHNRRYFFDYFLNHLGENHKHLSELSIISFDIDDFKQINDNYGHQVGDSTIIAVAKAAQDTLRKNDIISRFGGDEFVIALPRTSSIYAEEVANRILEKIAAHSLRLKNGEDIRVTVSIGVVHLSQADNVLVTIEKLLELADNALYTSKRLGKNKVTIATVDSESVSST